MGGAALLVGIVLADGRGRRWEGFLLVTVYVGVALAFLAAGDR
jgi:Ca2+/H+ antiporter